MTDEEREQLSLHFRSAMSRVEALMQAIENTEGHGPIRERVLSMDAWHDIDAATDKLNEAARRFGFDPVELRQPVY